MTSDPRWKKMREAAEDALARRDVFLQHPANVLALFDALDAAEQEAFALAANQCHDGYGDEYGNHRCRRIDATVDECAVLAEAVTKATAELSALREAARAAVEALTKAPDAISSAYLQAHAERQGRDIRAGKYDRVVMASRSEIRAALANLNAALSASQSSTHEGAPK